jgi:hypothetical protein
MMRWGAASPVHTTSCERFAASLAWSAIMANVISCIHCGKSFEKDWIIGGTDIPIALLLHQEKCNYG